jgi:hypothetical protein
VCLFPCYIMPMQTKREFFAVLLVLLVAAVACNLPGRSQTTPVPPVVEAPPLPESTQPPVPQENCISPLEPGIWAGAVSLASSASRMGFQVIEQQAALPLNLLVNCDGTVSGTAARSGQATINVPLAVNGTCTDSVQYEVRGTASGPSRKPDPGFVIYGSRRRYEL